MGYLKEIFCLSSESTRNPMPPVMINKLAVMFSIQFSLYPTKLLSKRENPALQKALTEWNTARIRAFSVPYSEKKTKKIKGD